MGIDLQGKTVVVTGAAGNVGQAMCRVLLAAQANTFALVRKESDLAELSSRLDGQGRLDGAVADMSDTGSATAAVDAAFRRFDGLYGIVNLVGGYAMGESIADTTDDLLDRMLDLNLRSAFNGCRAAMRLFERGSGGRIVNVAAYTGHTLAHVAKMGAYAISKAAVIALTKVLAEEGKELKVTANCLAPGIIRTPQNVRAMPKATHEKWASVEEVAAAALLCLSPDASGLTGALLPVTGRA